MHHHHFCSGSEVARVVRFVVVDSDANSTPSAPATVTINFESIDNPPVLDLNGPQQAGRNYSATFEEETDPVMVRTHSLSTTPSTPQFQ